MYSYSGLVVLNLNFPFPLSFYFHFYTHRVLFRRKQANTESILPTEEIGGVAETQHTTNHFDDPLGAADIRECRRMQEARIDALVGSHGDINTPKLNH